MAAPNAETRLLNLSNLRTELESNVSELADKTGLTRQTISKIESGEPVRLNTINTVFEAVRDLYGNRFDKIDLKTEDQNNYIIDFRLKSNGFDDPQNELFQEHWKNIMEQTSLLIIKASENRKIDRSKILEDVKDISSVAAKLLGSD